METPNKEKILTLARKLLALKIQGVGGEAENAGRQLDALMKKYDLLISDIQPDARKQRMIETYSRGFMKRVIHAVLSSVLTADVPLYNSRNYKYIYVDMTDREFAEYEYRIPKYKAAFKKHLERQQKVATEAFISKNNLYYHGPSDRDSDESRELSAEEKAIIWEAMRQDVERVRVDKALNSGS